jgi:hypothetical protein
VSKGHCRAEDCESNAQFVDPRLGPTPYCGTHEGIYGDEWDRCTVSTCYRWAVRVGDVALCRKHGGKDYLGGGDS